MNSHNTPLLRLCRASKRYGENGRRVMAVAAASLSLYRGETVILLGPSGSGKTTLLQLAAGLIAPTDGEVELLGKSIDAYSAPDLQQARACRIGFVFQTCRLLDPLSVTDNVALPLRFAASTRSAARRQAEIVLGEFKVAHLGGAYPPQLSQGEKQRVAAARALVNQPDLIFADEPTASLESGQGTQLMKNLSAYVKEHAAGMLVATHDLRLLQFADRIIRIDDGVVTERGEAAAAYAV